MLAIMIKNNLKLMLRNKLMILLILISPIMVMGALSSAFDGLLQSDYEYETVKVGYAVQKGSILDTFLLENKEQFQEQKMELIQLEVSEGKEQIQTNEIDVFFVEDENEITVFSQSKNSIPTEMSEYILKMFYKEYGNVYREALFSQIDPGFEAVVDFQTATLDSLTLSSAGNYYGIIEVVYFMWMMGMLFLTAVVQSERKNRISQRFISAPSNAFLIYLSKFIPAFVFSSIGTVVSCIVATALFDVQWQNLEGSVGIMFCCLLAGTAFGIAILYLVNNLAVSIIIAFGMIWFAGFVGGSFETYMFSAVSEKIKCLSPIYYVNRTLVEFSVKGTSDYAKPCVVFTLLIFVVFSGLGSILMKKRMEVE